LIADYTFAKDALFAGLNLAGDELDTYKLVHRALAERIQIPDLIIFLRVSTKAAMQRIEMRDRPYERNMELAYIGELNQAYEAFFSNRRELPVLIVDTNQLNFVEQRAHLDLVVNRIRQALQIPPFQQHLPLEEQAGP